MPDQTSRGDIVDVSVDAKISLAVNVDRVQSNEDGWISPKLDVVECDWLALLELRLVRGTNVRRVGRHAKDVLLILWICDPASLRGVEDSISPTLDIERESVHVNVSGGGLETPVAATVEIDVVQEDDDFGRGNERALKVDAHGGGVAGVDQQVAHVFTSEKLHIGGWEDEHIIDGSVESGVVPGCDVAVSPRLGEVLVRRLDADVGIFVNI